MLSYWKQETYFGSPLDCLENNYKVLESPVICHNNSNTVIFFLRSRKIHKNYTISTGNKKHVYGASLFFSLILWAMADCPLPKLSCSPVCQSWPCPTWTFLPTPGLWVNWLLWRCKSCKHCMSMKQPEKVIWLKKELGAGNGVITWFSTWWKLRIFPWELSHPSNLQGDNKYKILNPFPSPLSLLPYRLSLMSFGINICFRWSQYEVFSGLDSSPCSLSALSYNRIVQIGVSALSTTIHSASWNVLAISKFIIYYSSWTLSI